MVTEGQKFPKFELKNQDGEVRTLNDYEGKWLVVYVYPKDDTPGCTIEGRAFSAARPQFLQANTEVVGLSADDVDSHKDFCAKYSFGMDLLADPDTKLLSELGLQQVEFKGQKYWPRTTYLLDPAGVVKKVYENVTPEGHEKQVLEDVKQLQ